MANVIELFERLAFYGCKAILAVYLAEQVGLGREGPAGWWAATASTLFFLPILAGPFVDRYGFKRSLATCFAIFAIGYFAVGLGRPARGPGRWSAPWAPPPT